MCERLTLGAINRDLPIVVGYRIEELILGTQSHLEGFIFYNRSWNSRDEVMGNRRWQQWADA